MLHFIKRDGKQYRNFYFIYYYFSLPSTLLNVSSAIFVYFSSIASAFLFNSSAYSLSAMDFVLMYTFRLAPCITDGKLRAFCTEFYDQFNCFTAFLHDLHWYRAGIF